ncbi:MAG: septum formation protein Maf [Saprospirales bacterium]|nr:MAG: septum formation protein Maf [Saprospirales bacterium]
MIESLDFPPILLASQSPRRKVLLEMAGFSFRQISPQVKEVWPESLPISEIPAYLAKLKATAVVGMRKPGEVVISADSIVVLDGEVIGKPIDSRDAAMMLRRMSDRQHTVITGVCLLSDQGYQIESETATVKMARLSEEEISYYINTWMPLDKAGAYGIQEWIGLCRVARMEGTFSNIMGLPMYIIYEGLKKIALSSKRKK